MTGHPSIAHVAKVARSLGTLSREFVFVGGSAVPLLVPQPVQATIRPTDDVDCVVDLAKTHEYHELGARLRALGFQECRDDDAPICRWVIDGIRVDIMPTREAVLGFRNQWYSHVVDDPSEVEVEPGLSVRVPRAPVFLATKFDALADRGSGNLVADPDFEDIVTVLAHQERIVEQIRDCEAEVRTYLVSNFEALITRADIADLASHCFDGDPISQSSVPRVLEVMRQVVASKRAGGE